MPTCQTAESAQPTRKKSPRKQEDEAPPKTLTTEEILQYVDKLAESWEERFEEHHHNSYVVRYATFCLCFGAEKEEAVKHMADKFGGEYADTERVAREIYKHTERLGTWKIRQQGDEEQKRYTSMRALLGWLGARYEMHHNTLSNQYEVRAINTGEKLYLDWTEVDTRVSNSLFVKMELDNICTTQKKLDTVIRSNFSPEFDPLDDYLRSLPKWKKGEDPDYIDQLADRIEVENLPDNEHTQSLFRYFFKKWLVAMVVAWVTLKVVNQMILIFVGKGGIFKTTFFHMLLPPQLRQYFLNDSTGAYTDKDFMEAFSSKALLCLDEFEMVFGKNLSAFKSNMTKVTFSIRRPYDKYRSEMPHRGSLCGTTNSQQFITDEENRRYCPWLVKSIESPIEHPIDYDHVFAEAVALGQEVMSHPKGEPLKWTYWLTRDDIELMRSHNRLFMVANYAEEQILRYYRVPEPDTPLQFIKFRYSAEILERIGVNPALRQNLNNQNIGNVMKRLGFKKIHKKNGNGWAVIEKEGSEINNDAFIDPNDTMED